MLTNPLLLARHTRSLNFYSPLKLIWRSAAYQTIEWDKGQHMLLLSLDINFSRQFMCPPIEIRSSYAVDEGGTSYKEPRFLSHPMEAKHLRETSKPPSLWHEWEINVYCVKPLQFGVVSYRSYQFSLIDPPTEFQKLGKYEWQPIN